jgi:hypothetical protein
MSDKPNAAAMQEEFFEEYVCRVLVEANGPRGDTLATFVADALSQIKRVEPMINQLSGEFNPYLSRQDPKKGGILGARPPTYVILLNTRLVDEDSADATDENSTVLTVATTILRPEPFVCMIQHIAWLPVQQLKAFAANVVNALNEHPRDGVADFLETRDMLLRLARENG